MKVKHYWPTFGLSKHPYGHHRASPTIHKQKYAVPYIIRPFCRFVIRTPHVSQTTELAERP